MTCARLPTQEAEFRISLFNGADGKDHFAMVCGDVGGQEDVLTRVHSECLTGDVLGSLRCDCGPQLEHSLKVIGQAGRGVLVYLRQEGRGIGLLEKLKAYNLQDEGFDTVDANIELGHDADAREYSVAALILRSLKVRSIVLLTNNPDKVSSLNKYGIRVARRQTMKIHANSESAQYLRTKVERMNHQIAPEYLKPKDHDETTLWLGSHCVPANRPLVTVAYAQSIDGSIAAKRGCPLAISGPESLLMTHKLRRAHDAILVGIDTVLADDPRLTVRLVSGSSPRPVVADSKLRFPLDARLLQNPNPAIIGTAPGHDPKKRKALEAAGIDVIEVPPDPRGGIDLCIFLQKLRAKGVNKLMVEGGARILNSFLRCRLGDRAVITVAPKWVGGLRSVVRECDSVVMPSFEEPRWQRFGDDMAILANLKWAP
jgi:GTP cyclohydrolase II